MSHRHALIAGATGLVGSRLVACLAADDLFGSVTALVRRPLGVSHPKLTTHVIDFGQPGGQFDERVGEQAGDVLAGATDVFCALGTTIAAAGSQEAFRRVDHDLVIALAGACARAGATRFFLVSSVGADAASRNFYLRVKGETERDVTALGFVRVDIFRPGLLVGPRSERRPGEALAQRLLPRVDWLLGGPFSKYRSVEAGLVARAVAATARHDAAGRYIHEYGAIVRLAGGVRAG